MNLMIMYLYFHQNIDTSERKVRNIYFFGPHEIFQSFPDPRQTFGFHIAETFIKLIEISLGGAKEGVLLGSLLLDFISNQQEID